MHNCDEIRERHTAVDGLGTRLLEAGDGAPVMLLHGASLGSSADVWERTLRDLSRRGFRAVAPDLPGFGRTPVRDDHSLSYRRRFVVALMDALGLAQAHLIGHSQAGRIAVEIALNHPERVSSAIVLGTGSLLPPAGNGKQANEGEEGGTREPRIEETRALLEDSLYHRELATDAAVALRHHMSIGAPFVAFRARQSARGSGEKKGVPLWQRLQEVRVPLLMLYGEQDRGDAAVRAAEAKGLYPQLDIRVLPNCRHLVQWDAADALADIATTFMRAAR